MNVGLWQIISSTDLMSKVVLLVLLGMSILCWALGFYKKMIISTKIKALKQAQGLLQNTKSMDDFLARVSVIQTNFAGELIGLFLADFKKLLKIYESGDNVIADKDWYLLQGSINQRVDEALADEEFLIPVLSANAQAAPLIGLFGTVWGLIHAFMGIAQQRTADIAAVAPGIAEALITTMGGLVVAIPALVLFNYAQAQMKKFEHEVFQLAETCLWTMRSVLAVEMLHRPGFIAKPAQAMQKESL